jgi:hypothetical protein
MELWWNETGKGKELPAEECARLWSSFKSSSHLTVNMLHHHYRDWPVLFFRDISAVCCENTAKHRNTPCSEKNADVLTGRADGAFSYHSLVVCVFFSCLHENHRRGRKSVFIPRHRLLPEPNVRYSLHVTSASRCAQQKRYENFPMMAPEFKQNWKLSTVFSGRSQYQIS